MTKRILVLTILVMFIFGILANQVEAMGLGRRGFWIFGESNLDGWVQRMEEMFENWSEVLGIGIDKIKNYWAEGKTIKEIMERENISQGDVQKRMNEMRLKELRNQLQKLVEKGIITHEQADKRLKFLEGQLERILNRREGGKFGPRLHWFWLW